MVLQIALALPEEGDALSEISDKLEALQVYFEAEMYDEASALLDELIVRFPQEQKFIYLRGIVDYQKGDYARAEKVFLEFIESFPEVAEPYYLLGEMNEKLGKQDLAREYLTKYCELAPQDTDARQKLDSISASPDIKPQGVIILKEGREDLTLVKKIDFYGYGTCIYSPQMQSLKLINGGLRIRSSMEMDFTYPLDLRGKRIAFNLKGQQGGENLALTFRDKFAPNYNPQLVLTPAPGLSGDWQDLSVDFAGLEQQIDLSAVVHMGVELGSAEGQEAVTSSLLIKDIVVADADN